ncbi:MULTISPECIES: hypothetical protein [Gemella]|uniref:hypothetical protein n=1 Tax=Gemella TaxID=1378 RepID=UPI000931EDF9|nr:MULTISPECIES: hypothetical protein [Gemella]AXI27270.1 hypothetical protein CG018_07570 [Gemella sp. ND 6198]
MAKKTQKKQLFKLSKKFKDNKKMVFEAAQSLSVGDRMLFEELFDVFETHVGVCRQLKAEMDSDGVIIEKEYVKGRPTIVAHPAITNYNASSKALTATVAQLSKLFDKLGEQKNDIDLKSILKREVV